MTRRPTSTSTRAARLRLVKKTVNFDQPDVYHLYSATSEGPGSILTFFEFLGAPPGRAGAGMVHLIRWAGRRPGRLDFWAQRLGNEGIAAQRDGGALRFADPEGLATSVVADVFDPLLAAHARRPR